MLFVMPSEKCLSPEVHAIAIYGKKDNEKIHKMHT